MRTPRILSQFLRLRTRIRLPAVNHGIAGLQVYIVCWSMARSEVDSAARTDHRPAFSQFKSFSSVLLSARRGTQHLHHHQAMAFQFGFANDANSDDEDSGPVNGVHGSNGSAAGASAQVKQHKLEDLVGMHATLSFSFSPFVELSAGLLSWHSSPGHSYEMEYQALSTDLLPASDTP